MTYVETPVWFACDGDASLGIVTAPAESRATGVLVVVGGPQYRAGSHRQFVRLARALASQGYPAFRFDRRGMGDSMGSARPFDDIDADIDAAIGAICAQVPALRGVVLWGLCDAASAIAIYAARNDSRVRGIALCNPWVHSEAGEAKVRVKHYYRDRLRSADFWRKLARGRIGIGKSLREAGAALGRAARPARSRRAGAADRPTFQARMAEGLRGFALPTMVVLSGRDYTAREYAELAGGDAAWQALMQRPNVRQLDLPDADHTFSRDDDGASVEQATLELVARCDAAAR